MLGVGFGAKKFFDALLPVPGILNPKAGLELNLAVLSDGLLKASFL